MANVIHVLFFFRKFSLSGTYRKILEIPTNLSWRIMHYNKQDDTLILSNIDEMRQRTPPQDKPSKLIILTFVRNVNFQ